MPKPRPPHLHRQVTRHGRTVWYVRVNRGQRIRIPGEYSSQPFWNAYQAAVQGQRPVARTARSGSLKWLLERYRESFAWAELSNATRRQRENIFIGVMKTAGDEPFTAVTRKAVEMGKDARHDTPARVATSWTPCEACSAGLSRMNT